MQKIIIIGNPGSGKSTLAKKLGKLLDLKIYHLDILFFKPNWVIRNKDDFDRDLKKIMQEDSWIIDGNYNRTMAMRIEHADTILFLDFPTIIPLFRIVKRRFQFRKQQREDVAEACKEKLDYEFFSFVATYRKKKRPKVLKMLEKVEKPKQVYIFKNDKDVDVFLNNLKSI